MKKTIGIGTGVGISAISTNALATTLIDTTQAAYADLTADLTTFGPWIIGIFVSIMAMFLIIKVLKGSS